MAYLQGRLVYVQLNMILICTSDEVSPGVSSREIFLLIDNIADSIVNLDYHVVQLCAVFLLPMKVCEQALSDITFPQHLAYVKWFTLFSATPHPHHDMYKILQAFKNNLHYATVIPVDQIVQSIMLFPHFGLISSCD